MEVEASSTNLNSGDCFVLLAPGRDDVMVWEGEYCSAEERIAATAVAYRLAGSTAAAAALVVAIKVRQLRGGGCVCVVGIRHYLCVIPHQPIPRMMTTVLLLNCYPDVRMPRYDLQYNQMGQGKIMAPPCVLCTVYSVRCTFFVCIVYMYYVDVLCTVYRVLCMIYCVLCTMMYCVLCTLLCTVYCVL